jgi:F-type H+-transporting ATPase subunit epsilon
VADAFPFSLVSPERELFAGEANSVLVPGTEGQFEVFADHAPIMATLSPGILEIRTSADHKRYFVRGGFVDVTASGLTVLAEMAIPEEDLRGDRLAREKDLAQRQLSDAGTPDERLSAERAKSVLAAY